jgi:hypothetical protein
MRDRVQESDQDRNKSWLIVRIFERAVQILLSRSEPVPPEISSCICKKLRIKPSASDKPGRQDASLKRDRNNECSRLAILAVLIGLAALPATAQDNYEIQVYSSEMDPPGTTTLELHSNFTAEGRSNTKDGVAPTNHALHETLEISHGFSDWFDAGIYLFTAIEPDAGWHLVGSHFHPRITVPESWHWPLGVSLGQEIGYQRRQFSENTWTYELQPILDKRIGSWYVAFNPTFDRALHGDDVHRGWEFSPNAKFSYSFNNKIATGLEYYGALGPATDFYPLTRQYHQFFPSVDLDLSPKWEMNVGVGWDPGHSSDHMIVKFILGRRFSWGGRDQDKNEQTHK